MTPTAVDAAPVLAGVPDVLRPAVELYLDVHRHPELSGAEERTAGRLADRLGASGYRVTTGIGGHGVVGLLRNGPGPVVLLRTELDALPVRERTGLSYASDVIAPGGDGQPVPVMHACGHDMHLACAAGAAALLSRTAGHWSGTVMVVGQPAEETLTGARAMLDDGLYTRFAPPDVVLAQHTVPLPAGMVAHAAGPVLAGSAMLQVIVHGRGGHAGAPHLTVDPVVTAAAIVLRLQTVVARETSPADQVVITVGSLHAGTRGNVVPDHATLDISVRAFTQESLDRATGAVRRVVRAECAASDCPAEPVISTVSRSHPTQADHGTAAAVLRAHERAFGPQRVAVWPPSLATEDFPLYGPAGASLHGVEGIRTAYWMLGSVGPRQWAEAPGDSAAAKLAALPPNHAPEFRPDPRLTVPAGITALTSAALAHLDPPGSPEGR
ncbi:amidohydrolase [Streptomyces sp. RKAG293]|uniref:amidohydrolase n=1 Tax=Streptomyces sp. RKAG293 TaxID=2893403 RepID=UPI00203430DB|nr:amidohydrolase [Streptomyces sp. RKAG293]MCM2423453.1 amidohydrolase [Streptomyces sp. RKAG293]